VAIFGVELLGLASLGCSGVKFLKFEKFSFFGKKFEFSKKWRIETHAWAGSQEEGLWETSPVN
jgi:hypothetical protein